MGIMEDVSIVPQPAGDSGKVDLTINAVERVEYRLVVAFQEGMWVINGQIFNFRNSQAITGLDVLNKIMSFSQNGPQAVCITSGVGVVTNVTLRQAAPSGGTATYEGRFDILALSGLFLCTFYRRNQVGGLAGEQVGVMR